MIKFEITQYDRDVLKEFFLFAIIQIVSYSVLTYNFRTIAHGDLAGALWSDGVNATLGFFVIRRIARSEDSIVGWLGYLTGSLIGTAIGMHL